MDAQGRGQERGQGKRQAREHGQEPCPECGRPREGGEPCGCGADGEEFSPLRVRPYVTVGEDEADGAEPVPTTYGGALPGATMRLPRVPGPGAPGTGEPAGEERGGGRRKGVYVASGAAVVVAGAVAALLAGGAFSSAPGTPGAAPGVAAAAEPSAVRTGGTEASPSASASLSPAAGASPSSSSSAASSPSASASGTTPSPGASASGSPAVSASGAVSPLPTRTAVRKPPTGGPSEQRPPEGVTQAVLRRGDSGPEVAKLEERLRAVGIYPGRDDGRFDRGLEYALMTYQVTRGASDEHGVYGADTRTKLEGETPQLG
ncbi:hypothetical protein GTY68_14040 [Streptomyces sp. SID4926]|nr:hypothetical protein [Streptomyces sp. SID4926]